MVKAPMNRQRGYITLILYGLAALAVIGAIYGVYRWIDHSWETTAGVERGRKEIQRKWDLAVAEQRAKEQKQSAAASTNLEADRVKTRTVYRTITKSVDKYIDRPIYRNVCFDSPGLRDANAALSRTGTDPGKPDAAVPAADAARERAGRNSAAEADRSR